MFAYNLRLCLGYFFFFFVPKLPKTLKGKTEIHRALEEAHLQALWNFSFRTLVLFSIGLTGAQYSVKPLQLSSFGSGYYSSKFLTPLLYPESPGGPPEHRFL